MRAQVASLFPEATDLVIDGSVVYPSMIGIPELDIDGINAELQAQQYKIEDMSRRVISMEQEIARIITGELPSWVNKQTP